MQPHLLIIRLKQLMTNLILSVLLTAYPRIILTSFSDLIAYLSKNFFLFFFFK